MPSWQLLDSDIGPLTSQFFPTAIGIGVFAAALTAGAPWLSRRWRQVGWVAVIALDADAAP